MERLPHSEKPTRHPTKTRIKFIQRCKVQGLCQSCFDQVAVQQLTMICLYSCWTALLTVSAHETGKDKATEGGKPNTEAPHRAYPAIDIRLSFKLTFGSQQSSQTAVRLVLQHLAFHESRVSHNYHQVCDVDESCGGDLVRKAQQFSRMPRTVREACICTVSLGQKSDQANNDIAVSSWVLF